MVWLIERLCCGWVRGKRHFFWSESILVEYFILLRTWDTSTWKISLFHLIVISWALSPFLISHFFFHSLSLSLSLLFSPHLNVWHCHCHHCWRCCCYYYCCYSGIYRLPAAAVAILITFLYRTQMANIWTIQSKLNSINKHNLSI